ncbi:nuclease-related domain-containing protein [Sporosarcina sp. GW1-11]|uniref:nuclease-related domain-containing protein n=1 Tax=Sporosarcina sp. GW1-11 TaxID=2899126 RepID=UPI00294BE9CB|nr:nuclease-related domain-containing protein [Sporosarcina sp. GW1-11]MDV6378764.1 nuclease-related domain-containing protein [Sporosarcina sp. GW1-11]
MIYKQRGIPKVLIGQQALLRRLSPDHAKFKKLQKDYYNSQAGYSGEKDFDYQMREFKPDYPYAILHDVYLQQDQVYFQIDSLLITPSCIVVFEVKNMAGKLLITQHPTQFIKEEPNGDRTVLKSPIEELERKKYFLTRWLRKNGVEIPLVDFVVLAYQNELIIENLATDKVAFSYEMPNRLRKLEMNQDWLSSREIRQLASQINTFHCNYNPFPLNKKYDVLPNDIR